MRKNSNMRCKCFKLAIILCMFFLSCNQEDVTNAKALILLNSDEYERIKNSEYSNNTIIDKDISLFLILPNEEDVLDLKISEIMSHPVTSVVVTKNDNLSWSKCMSEFFENAPFDTKWIPSKSSYTNLDHMLTKEGYHYKILDIEISYIKKVIKNTPSNRFFLNSNLTIDKESNFIKAYFAKSIKVLERR